MKALREPIVRWRPADFALRRGAQAVLIGCVRELGLGSVLGEIDVAVDVHNRDDHAYIEWNSHDPQSVRLFFAVGNFVTKPRRRAWRRTWGRRAGPPPLEPRHFSGRSFAEACFHELYHLKDDLEEGVDLAGQPEQDREALNELWNVWIDGRLNRRGLPAMGRRERFRIFARTLGRSPRYSLRGPRVFQALWTADHLGPTELRSFLLELAEPSKRAPRSRGRP